MTASNYRQPSTAAKHQQRRYAITYLDRTGALADQTVLAPAIPAFEDAFAAMGRDAMLETPQGPVPIEDIPPGDRVRLDGGDFAPVLWRGMITIQPQSCPTRALTRVVAAALGPGRPRRDVILGPAARLCQCTRGVTALAARRAAYIPASDFVDGSHFVALRPAVAVDLYQIGFASQETILVNGIGIESLHPGTAFSLGLHGDILDRYMAMFPHLADFNDLGLLKYPRLRLHDLDLLG
ncbi:MAG: Hint domain-containing protein [Loktanella sp.]|nr:Hint domain-containing protein [Loktanella sp.]